MGNLEPAVDVMSANTHKLPILMSSSVKCLVKDKIQRQNEGQNIREEETKREGGAIRSGGMTGGE